MATLPGAAERTLTISSAGKTFSFTGWKIGWLSGPEHLVAAARTVKQFLSYSSGTPFQAAIAVGLGSRTSSTPASPTPSGTSATSSARASARPASTS